MKGEKGPSKKRVKVKQGKSFWAIASEHELVADHLRNMLILITSDGGLVVIYMQNNWTLKGFDWLNSRSGYATRVVNTYSW